VTQSLHMNRYQPPLTNDASTQVLSKLVQPFLRRSEKKCEKLTRDTRRKVDDGRHFYGKRPPWTFGTDDLKIKEYCKCGNLLQSWGLEKGYNRGNLGIWKNIPFTNHLPECNGIWHEASLGHK